MARLSVNLNKIALLRNSRHTGVPDVRRFGRLALEFGAQGLTVHPRPDERHIRASDVPEIAALMAPYRPKFEFNIEGYPDDRLLKILQAVTAGTDHLGPGLARRLHLRRGLATRRRPDGAGQALHRARSKRWAAASSCSSTPIRR